MASKNTEELDYSEPKQRLLLQFLVSSSMIFSRCQNIIKPEYWDNKLVDTVKFILKFVNEYSVLPSPIIIKAETGVDLEFIDGIREEDCDYVLQNIEAFCRHKAMELLIYDGPDMLVNQQYSEIERRTKENMLISLQRDLGTNYFENPLARLQKLKDKSNMVSTGWKVVDNKLYGGFNRGELTFFVGGSGSGKSLFLQNISLNWVQMGLNVLYISLELSEELVGLRLDAMVTEMSTKQIFHNSQDAAMKIGSASKKSLRKWGDLQIKKMPEAGTTTNDIRAYIREYEIQTGKKADAVIIDYLDILYPNNSKIDPSNLFTKDKFVSEEVRALSSEFNVLTVTASQINRSGVNEHDYDHSHIAGGISKINTADNVLAIHVTPAMKERGEYQLQFLKTRSSNGVGQKVELKFDPETMRIRDYGEDEQPKERGMSALQSQLALKKTTATTPSLVTQFNDGKIKNQIETIRALSQKTRDE